MYSTCIHVYPRYLYNKSNLWCSYTRVVSRASCIFLCVDRENMARSRDYSDGILRAVRYMYNIYLKWQMLCVLGHLGMYGLYIVYRVASCFDDLYSTCTCKLWVQCTCTYMYILYTCGRPEDWQLHVHAHVLYIYLPLFVQCQCFAICS